MYRDDRAVVCLPYIRCARWVAFDPCYVTEFVVAQVISNSFIMMSTSPTSHYPIININHQHTSDLTAKVNQCSRY